MNLLEEMKEFNILVTDSTQAKVHCKVFEDNSGALEMAKVYKYRPRTKHLNVKLHWFCSLVEEQKVVTIHKIDTLSKLADYLTKPLPLEKLEPLRKMVMGW